MRSRKNKISLSFLFALTLFVCCTKEKGELVPMKGPGSPCDSINVTYTSHIQQIVQVNCIDNNCHNGGNVATKGVDLRDYNKLLEKALNGALEDEVVVKKNMPGTYQLPDSTIQKVKCWIDAGAPEN